MKHVFTWVFAICVTAAFADVTLPRLISNGMILQREAKVNVWGWASEDEEVNVAIDGKTYHAKPYGGGRWNVIIDAHAPGGPFEIVITGKNKITLSDIYFGDVWVCSGQSNMELTMDRVRDKYPRIINSYRNPLIRQFLVPDQYDFRKAQEDLSSGSWVPLTTESISEFSAVALFFARDLFERYGIPIGLINAALGGSPVEAWMSEDAIKNFPESFKEYKKFQNDNVISSIERRDQERSKEWYATLNAGDPGLHDHVQWKSPEYNDHTWRKIEVPGFWSDNGFTDFNGSAWYRRDFEIPESMVGKPARLWLGRIVDQDSVFLNGDFVGTTGYQYPPRKYSVKSGVLLRKKNVLAVRVINVAGKGGFVSDKPYIIFAGSDTVRLSGVWKFRKGAEMKELPAPTAVRWKPVGLFNKMIYPLLQYNIKGVIWYQGESNVDKADNYEKAFTSMINDWREKWRQKDLPFLFVQLANFMETQDKPSESNWALLRQAQLNTLSLKNTGMAVTIDIGEWNDIHPMNKQDVGKRLALLAQKIAYGDSVLTASGPQPRDVILQSGKVVVQFSNAEQGLLQKDKGTQSQFTLSEDGIVFYPAEMILEENKVILSSKKVKQPVKIRYAWADNPGRGLLFNQEGLPATPFEWKINNEKQFN